MLNVLPGSTIFLIFICQVPLHYKIQVWLAIGYTGSQQIDIKSLQFAIQQTSPSIVMLVICYSQFLDLRFLLEETGIFSELRMNRELSLISKGKFITLNDVQQTFIEMLSKKENITKRLTMIQGKVGSGKSILGIESVKMKCAHYVMKYKLKATEAQNLIKVMIIIADDNAELFKNQISKELIEDVGPVCNIEIHSKLVFGAESVSQLVQSDSKWRLYKHTILMIDECWDDVDQYTSKALENDIDIDYIHCVRYEDLGFKTFGFSVSCGNAVGLSRERIDVQLSQNQRSSQPILDFADYMITHAFPYSYLALKYFPSTDSFFGPKPQWLNVKNLKEFLDFADTKLKDFKDVLVISWDQLRWNAELAEFCDMRDWKYCTREQVKGSEATMVIIHDFEEFSYESFTRARNQLIIVTLENKSTKLKFALKRIVRVKPTSFNRYCEGMHDEHLCEVTRKKHYKWFNCYPPDCKYKTHPEKIGKLVEKIDT